MLFLAPAELLAFDRRALEDLLGRSDAAIAFGAGDVRGFAAAALPAWGSPEAALRKNGRAPRRMV